jgi:hypothetical protein
MASFTITPLTNHTGVEVIGLDSTQPIDTENRAVLRRAFVEHHVLVMRDQHFTPDQFKAAVQLFGEVQPHDKMERHVPGHPGVDYVSNDEIVDGRHIIPGETFHTDHSNHPRPPKATTLLAIELPSSGGDTQYVNMHDAFDDLLLVGHGAPTGPAAIDETIAYLVKAKEMFLSPPMLLMASSTFWPSARTPMTTSSEIAVALRSSRTRTTVPSRINRTIGSSASERVFHAAGSKN